MPSLRVSIERFTEADFPGWVECRVVDAGGAEHLFEDKVPAVSTEDLDAASDYPREGGIGCTILSLRVEPDGRELVMVRMNEPPVIKTGELEFEVARGQLLDDH
jgi:hypothetical protein